jgi:microsomal dipeptidase-like Zn-dependent dipeptidase
MNDRYWSAAPPEDYRAGLISACSRDRTDEIRDMFPGGRRGVALRGVSERNARLRRCAGCESSHHRCASPQDRRKAARTEADAKLAWIQTFVKDHPDRVALALSSRDIERIHAAGKIAVIESFLNARSIGSDISAIDTFYRDGVRLFGLPHAGNNDFADSSRPTGEPGAAGIFGR